MPDKKKNHPKGAFYVLKKITRLAIKCNLRDPFIRLFSLGLWLYFKIKNNIELVGIKNLPKSGPYILAGNHSSVADAGLLVAVYCGILGKRFYYIANSRDFKNDNFQRYFHILFEGKPRIGKGQDMIKYMVAKLLEGKVIAIPPEGMYNKNGKIMKGFTGITRVYHIANNHSSKKIPIVPIVSIGANKAYPTTPDADGKYRNHKIKIIGRIGKPFYLDKIESINTENLRKQTDYIMEIISELALQKEGPVESWILAEKDRNKPRIYK